jgi:hypothetical protein
MTQRMAIPTLPLSPTPVTEVARSQTPEIEIRQSPLAITHYGNGAGISATLGTKLGRTRGLSGRGTKLQAIFQRKEG